MTAVLHRAPSTVDLSAWSIGAPRLLAGLRENDTATLGLGDHLQAHGPLPGTDLERILTHLDHAAIAGRGGAGFPLAAKLRALAGHRRQVVVNGTESDPSSRKDRVLLNRTPHLVLDGALAVARAVGARVVTVAVHDARTAEVLVRAAAERSDGPGVRIRVIDGRFVGGEARAVLRALAGGPALPTGRRTPPSADGTVICNAETFAQLAVLLRLGPRRFAGTGTPEEPGTTLVSVGGAVERPGVVETPLGAPLGILLAAARAVPLPQAVVLGGYHGSWVRPIPQLRLSRAGAAAAGAAFGSGVVLVLGPDTCALGELARVADWLAAESAGQCGPCVFGLPAIAADLAQIAAGRPAVGAAFEHARAVTGRGACAHPDGAARFVSSGLHALLDEVEAHQGGGCGRPVLGQLPLPTPTPPPAVTR